MVKAMLSHCSAQLPARRTAAARAARGARRGAPARRAAAGAGGCAGGRAGEGCAPNAPQLRLDAESSPSLAGLGAASASPLLSLLLAPAAEAATSPVASAGAAYGHYLCLLLMVASLTVERCTVNEKPTKEDITTLLVADSVYGIAGIGMIYTGYLRVAKYAKGWEFYQHEPLFWTKMFLFGVVGSASLFCTASIIRMQIAMTNDGVPPELGAKLTKRMRSIINAELTGFLSIPFVATLMARGVSYNDDFDWHLGAGLVAVGSLGATAKYVKEALSYDIPGDAAAEEKYATAEAK